MKVIKNEMIFKNIESVINDVVDNRDCETICPTLGTLEEKWSLKQWLIFSPLIIVFAGISWMLDSEGINTAYIMLVIVIGVAIYIKLFKKKKLLPDILTFSEGQVFLINRIQEKGGKITFDRLIIFTKEDISKKFDFESLIDWIPDGENLIEIAGSVVKSQVESKFNVKLNLGNLGKLTLEYLPMKSLLYDNLRQSSFRNRIVSLKVFAKKYFK